MLQDCVCHVDGTLHPTSTGDGNCFEDWLPFVNDGKCQEFTNHEDCASDGSDCCQEIINDAYCWGEGCTCFLTGQIHMAPRAFSNCTAEHALLINGNCDPEANVEECNWDMGDCCMNKKNDYRVRKDPTCIEGCKCHETGTSHFSTFPR